MNRILILLLFGAFILRLIPVDFPSLTADEARIAFRAHTLAKTGKDELGRSFPLIFNSIIDYKLPATSYIAALGAFIFGKSELGVRMPFIIIGTLLIFLVFQISKTFSDKPLFWFMSGFIAATSPTLIFLSKTPNEVIILTFLLTLIFYLIINNKNQALIIYVSTLAVMTSKLAWFILLPFVLFTIPFYKKSNAKFLIISIAFVTILAFGFFLNIPQSKRSLIENNISLFNDITIKNGIDRLRGQGLESSWLPIIKRILFNKTHFIFTSILNWISHFNPALYFGRFDEKGILSYSFVGAYLKILIIPAFLGIVFIIKSGGFKILSLFFYFLIITYTSFLLYPRLSLELIALTLPFFSILIAFGTINFNKSIIKTLLLFVFLELIINIYNPLAEKNNTDILRPNWLKSVSQEISANSQNYLTAVSDDLAEEIIPFLQWYGPYTTGENYSDISWPYKFRQYKQANIKIIGSEDKFRSCGGGERNLLYLSRRDLEKIQKEFKFEISKFFKDVRGNDKLYLLSNNVCLN